MSHGGRRIGSYPHCVACGQGKLAAATPAIARQWKREIQAISGHTNPVRYYQCELGFYHWTRMLEPPQEP